MERIWDISLPIAGGMLAWPGDPPVSVAPAARISAGAVANVSELRLGSHTGTHIDPPSHFLDGAPAADQVPLDALIGDCTVVEIRRSAGTIDPADLEAADLGGATRVLFKTGNSALWTYSEPAFPAAYASLSAEGAAWLVRHGVRLVGIDFLSIEAPGGGGGEAAAAAGGSEPPYPVHRALLGAGVVIVEGLDLSAVEPGPYRLICLPLRLAGGDGAPARAVLLAPG
jgi:arylformamidase